MHVRAYVYTFVIFCDICNAPLPLVSLEPSAKIELVVFDAFWLVVGLVLLVRRWLHHTMPVELGLVDDGFAKAPPRMSNSMRCRRSCYRPLSTALRRWLFEIIISERLTWHRGNPA